MMKKLRRRLFILAILFALLSSGGVYVYLQSLDDAPVVVEETYTILVASIDIPARTVITESMLEQRVTKTEPQSDIFYTSASDVIGKYAVSHIYAGSQIHLNSTDASMEQELSLKISGNMRAVSVGVNGLTGVANMIKPGDRVDVVLYLPSAGSEDKQARPDIVKMLMQNVEVLAVDKDLTVEEEAVVTEANTDSAKTYLATLAIPVNQVEILILAKDIGLLELVLRPLDGDFVYNTEGVIWQELLLDDFDKLKDMYPNYEVNNVGEVIIDPDEVQYEKYIYYTVEYGDTLKEISQLFYGTEEHYLLLKQVNDIDDVDIISAGIGLKIPVLEDRGEIIEQN
jgi:pilus assembly protein CpaB